MDRRLAAILSADIAGFSRLMGQDETGTLARLKALRADHFEPLLARHKGRFIKLMCDGALVELASVVDTVDCAVALQDGLAQRNAALPETERPPLRIGINLGDVVVEGDDIYGDGVNFAARIKAPTEPGGICVAQTSVDHAAGKTAVQFTDLGEKTLKDIAKPVRVWQVAPEPSVAPIKPSIAMLPFDNISGNPEQDYFYDGITEDIITALSRFSGLLIIARNSSFSYRGRAVDLRQIARAMGMLHLVEGSIRRAMAGACQARLGRLEEARATLSMLEAFSRGFLPRVLNGTLTICKLPKHRDLLKDA